MKIKNKWIISLDMFMIVSLMSPVALYSMSIKEKKELFTYFTQLPLERQDKIMTLQYDFFRYMRELPQELQEKILLQQDSTLLQDAIVFLGLQPITLELKPIDLASSVNSPKLMARSDGIWVSAVPKTNTAKIQKQNGDMIILNGHGAPVTAVAIVNDKVLTGSADATVKIWDISNGDLLHTLRGKNGHVKSIKIANDKVIITSKNAHNAQVWDINSGVFICKLIHKGIINSVATGGDIVVTGSDDKTAKIWNINNCNLLRTLEGHTGPILAVEIEGNKVITKSKDYTQKKWPIELNFQEPSESKSLEWIIKSSNMPQLNLIVRAYEATATGKEFIIAFPSEDAKIFLSLPKDVQIYLLERLKIRR